MKAIPTLDRLHAAVVVGDDGCWIWQRYRRKGYGQIAVGRQVLNAHRVAYELLVGPIPDGLELDHLCCTRACVNPDHLEPVTHLENIRRAVAARTHCSNGHEFTVENTYIEPSGTRRCITCRKVGRLRREGRKAS